MGLLDSVGTFFKYNPATAIPYAIGDKMDVLGVHAQEDANAYQNSAAAQRAYAKQQQLGMLNQMKGPTLTPQQEARIKALEQESTVPMIQDPNFQSQIRQATTGGAQALGAIQNRQAATGAKGGFQNVGSISDVYDRVGGQLSQLAQGQQQLREQKRDAAADMRQGIADAQVAYDNSILSAKMAIEAGDAQAAQQAMAAAYAAKQQIQNNTRQMMLGIGQLGLGALTGNPLAAAGGAQSIAGAQNQGQGPTVANYQQSMPSIARDDYTQQLWGAKQQYAPNYINRAY